MNTLRYDILLSQCKPYILKPAIVTMCSRCISHWKWPQNNCLQPQGQANISSRIKTLMVKTLSLWRTYHHYLWHLEANPLFWNLSVTNFRTLKGTPGVVWPENTSWFEKANGLLPTLTVLRQVVASLREVAAGERGWRGRGLRAGRPSWKPGRRGGWGRKHLKI